MRLEQLSHIIEIARQRSFSRAAEKLYISQPALSVSIKNLEAELGKVLFKRTNKGIALTSDGNRSAATQKPSERCLMAGMTRVSKTSLKARFMLPAFRS